MSDNISQEEIQIRFKKILDGYLDKEFRQSMARLIDVLTGKAPRIIKRKFND